MKTFTLKELYELRQNFGCTDTDCGTASCNAEYVRFADAEKELGNLWEINRNNISRVTDLELKLAASRTETTRMTNQFVSEWSAKIDAERRASELQRKLEATLGVCNQNPFDVYPALHQPMYAFSNGPIFKYDPRTKTVQVPVDYMTNTLEKSNRLRFTDIEGLRASNERQQARADRLQKSLIEAAADAQEVREANKELKASLDASTKNMDAQSTVIGSQRIEINQLRGELRDSVRATSLHDIAIIVGKEGRLYTDVVAAVKELSEQRNSYKFIIKNIREALGMKDVSQGFDIIDRANGLVSRVNSLLRQARTLRDALNYKNTVIDDLHSRNRSWQQDNQEFATAILKLNEIVDRAWDYTKGHYNHSLHMAFRLDDMRRVLQEDTQPTTGEAQSASSNGVSGSGR